MKWRKRVCGHGLENFAGKLTGRNKNREETLSDPKGVIVF